MERNQELDFLRGFSIIWVLIIHCLYWVGFFTSENAMVLKSFLLLEMPLLFLITGATNSLSKKHISYNKFLFKRIPRIIIPYWVYAFICVFITQLTITFFNLDGKVNYFTWFVTFGYKMDWWSNIPYVTWHLWFIPVYLILIFIIPLLKKLFFYLKDNNKYIPFLIITIIIAILDFYNFGHDKWYYVYFYLKNIIFFSFWIYLGFFYNNHIKKVYLLIIATLSYIITYSLIKFGYIPDMQINKFPPNLVFLFLNIGNVAVVFIFKDILIKFAEVVSIRKLINYFGYYSYTVYLYQPFAFLSGGMILALLNIDLTNNDILGVVYYLIINIIFGILFIKIFGKVESWSFLHFSLHTLNRAEKIEIFKGRK